MSEIDVLQAVERAAVGGRPAALATVIRTRGSVPRHTGSRMVVDAEGGLVGTIGGGCGEGEVIEAAREVMASRSARVVRVELLDPVDSFGPATCGGVMDVFVEPIGGGSEAS